MFQISVGKEWSWNPRKYSDLGIETNNEDGLSEMCRTFFDFSEIDSNSMTTMSEEPVEIIITYTNDLNLPVIHSAIREKIIRISKNLQIYDDELVRIESNISSGRLTPIDIKEARSRIEKIIEFKRNYTGYNIWALYKQNVIGILNKYVILMSNEYKGKSVVGSNISMDESKIQERLQYIREYINTVNKLNILKLKATYKNNKRQECQVCSSPLNEDSIDEFSKYVCRCGFTENSVKHVSEYVDTTKIPSQITTKDPNIKTIQTWINRVTCSSLEVYPKDEMFNDFDNLCFQKNLPRRSDVLNSLVPQPPMKVILDLLKGKYSGYYKIKHQIRKEYYGYPTLELSDTQIAFIISLYVDFQSNYLLTKGRKTSINIEILGCLFLLLSGAQIIINDYKIPESEDTVLYAYSKILETMIIMKYDEKLINSLLAIIFN